ncbi:ATP-binding cassette domain-containing protein [Streptomyces sp. NPDC048718]|uniref:ATP-binding cassette domain-containing protein n=1 Tax=Streptomyces sp. NPDC048718 TaxID=3365587 RepID=UPI0037196F27
MLQAIGLTSTPRRDLPPAVDNLTFEARPGTVTALLGPVGAGKTTALRLMLQLEPGRGITYFRGRTLHRIAHPAREVGVLFGDVPGHPSRTARSQLRMLCAAAGVPGSRADDMLGLVGLTGARDRRIGTLPLVMDRRLGLACALLGGPHTLLLDEPGARLSVRESAWLYELLHAHADEGGTVLYTTADPKDAARNADRVVTLDQGRLIADQEAVDFARTRLRPRVAVRTPYATRLAVVLSQEARAARRPVEVVAEGGNHLSVYGSDCATVGESAFRHGLLLHRLADETGDAGDSAVPRQAPAPSCVPQLLQSHPSAVPVLAPVLAPARKAPWGAVPPVEESGTGAASDLAPGADVRTGAEAVAADPSGAPGVVDVDRPRSSTELKGAPIPGPAQDPGGTPAVDPEGAPSPEAEDAPTQGPESAPAQGPADAPVPVPAPSADGAPPPEPEDVPPLKPGSVPPPEPEGARVPEPESVPAAAVVRAPRRSPLWPVRYEIRRLLGVPSTPLVVLGVLFVSLALSVLLARNGRTPLPAVLAGWPVLSPLPPAALGAGLVGAFSFGEEYRYPALTTGRGAVPRRLGLLLAKLAVTAAVATLLAVLVVVADREALRFVYGGQLVPVPHNWPALSANWFGLMIGCGWAGLLGAGVFRAAAAGVAAVLAVPVAFAPPLHHVLAAGPGRSVAGLPARLRALMSVEWSAAADRWVMAALKVVGQPVGVAMALTLTVLLCAYVLTGLRSKARW